MRRCLDVVLTLYDHFNLSFLSHSIQITCAYQTQCERLLLLLMCLPVSVSFCFSL